MKHEWFTLVELIVVITILAILWTIGFISYNGYLLGVRDSNRTTQLQELASGLELYRVKNTLSLPDKAVSVKANGAVIAYQGYMGQDQLDLIDYSKWGKDPKDQEYFTYYLTASRKNYELLAYLEDASNQTAWIFNTAYAVDYSVRYPTVNGKKLGVLTETATNLPIQTLLLSWGLDVATTTNNYTARFSDKSSVAGTGGLLQSLQYTALWGRGVGTSCNAYIKWNSADLYGKDGTYIIWPSWWTASQVYCDMTTDGGGRTRVKTGASTWISDSIKTKITDAQEMLFSYDSWYTWKQHKYVITNWATPTDNYEKIENMNDFINIILWSKAAPWTPTRNWHTGVWFKLAGKNIWINKDPCHPDMAVNMKVAYSWYSFWVRKEDAYFYLEESSQFSYLWWTWYNYLFDVSRFQSQYCGSAVDNASYSSTFTDVFVR